MPKLEIPAPVSQRAAMGHGPDEIRVLTNNFFWDFEL
jgi:hypothetical protein